MRQFIPVRRVMVVAPNPAPTGALDTIVYQLQEFRPVQWDIMRRTPTFFALIVRGLQDDLRRRGAEVKDMVWHCHQFDIEVGE